MWRGENARAGSENPRQDPCPQPTPDLYTPTPLPLRSSKKATQIKPPPCPLPDSTALGPPKGKDGVPPAAALPPAPGLADLPRRRLVAQAQPLLALDPPLWRQERRPRSSQCLRILVGCRRGAFWACVVDPRSSLSSLLEGGGDLRADLAPYPPASPDSSLCLVRASSLVGGTSSCTILTLDSPLACRSRWKGRGLRVFQLPPPQVQLRTGALLPSLPPATPSAYRPLMDVSCQLPISLESATSLTDSASVLLDSVGSTVSRLVHPRISFRQVPEALVTDSHLSLAFEVCDSLSDGPDRHQRKVGELCECDEGWGGINCNSTSRPPFAPLNR